MVYIGVSFILLVSNVYADTFFISDGNLEDPSFEKELVNGQFPGWTFSGPGSFIREEYREYDGEAFWLTTWKDPPKIYRISPEGRFLGYITPHGESGGVAERPFAVAFEFPDRSGN